MKQIEKLLTSKEEISLEYVQFKHNKNLDLQAALTKLNICIPVD